MRERPIIFSGEEVRAILEGRKTQTRRVLRKQPQEICYWQPNIYSELGWYADYGEGHILIKCPYGKIGSVLWVRETLRIKHNYSAPHYITYVADCTPVTIKNPYSNLNVRPYWTWKKDMLSSIHMPRWASRILLEITAIRVERVQDITEKDAKNEGIGGKDTITVSPDTTPTYRKAFEIYWDNMYSGRWKNKIHRGGFQWDNNPWVWVIGFKVIKGGV